MYFFVNSSAKADRKINKSHSTFCTNKCLKEAVDGKLQCNCGEDTPVFDWTWKDEYCSNVKLLKEGKEVLFHPVYSSGTAAVKGQLPFKQNYHYYWEIKMISKLYGTDAMIGVGTSKVELEDWRFKFCSLLGVDKESWGYSYHGVIQHNTLRRKYGIRYGLGSIIGVHLDMCNGTLEYFLHRKPLGIAFKDLKGKDLYPMVCSTAAQSSMRITCCMSKEPSLQMMCLKHILRHPGLYKAYKNIPGLSKIYDREFLWMKPVTPKDIEERKRMADLDEDVSLSLVERGYQVKKKKLNAVRLVSLLRECELENPLDGELAIYNMNYPNERTRRRIVEETEEPSTSGSSSGSSKSSCDISKSSESVASCKSCLSGSCIPGSLGDSDVDDSSGLYEIL